MQIEKTAVVQANHHWTATNKLERESFTQIGTFKRFERTDKTNEMLPVILFKPVTGSKLERRALTNVEFQQIWHNDVFSNELLYDVTYFVPGDSTHTRLEVANRFNQIQNQFTIH